MKRDLEQALNEYLLHEFGRDDGVDTQFALESLGAIDVDGERIEVFWFVDDEAYFALAGRTLSYLPQRGLRLPELRLQLIGSTWIGAQDPVDLATSRIGSDGVPRTIERRDRCQALADAAFAAGTHVRVLEGLWLRRRAEYLVLAGSDDGDAAIVVSDRALHRVGHAALSPSRRLSLGVGELLESGTLR